MNSTFKVGETVYTVNACSIGKGKIVEIVERNDGIKSSIAYTIQPVTRAKQAVVKECYLVRTLDEAKLSALKNLEMIYTNTLQDIKKITEKSFEIQKNDK